MMRYFWIAIIYMSVCGVVGFSVWVTESPWPLLGLFFIPDYKESIRQNNE